MEVKSVNIYSVLNAQIFWTNHSTFGHRLITGCHLMLHHKSIQILSTSTFQDGDERMGFIITTALTNYTLRKSALFSKQLEIVFVPISRSFGGTSLGNCKGGCYVLWNSRVSLIGPRVKLYCKENSIGLRKGLTGSNIYQKYCPLD